VNGHSPVLGDPTLQALANRLRAGSGLDAAYLLGSAATGRLRADSDLDIAILPSKGASFHGVRTAELAADLEEICGRMVDLGILHTGNLVYAKEAVAHGRVLFERDAGARARFEMHALSMYAELQENRRDVIHAYAA
jgi:predicted nucleotidyltransferase